MPGSGVPFLLRGQQTPPNSASLLSWSTESGGSRGHSRLVRAGVLNGGLHFAEVIKDLRSPQSARVTELAPAPQVPLLGSISNRAQATWAGNAQGVAANQTVVLIGTAVEILLVLSVVEGATDTVATFSTGAAVSVGQTVRLRCLGPPLGPESLQAQGARVG